MKIKIDATPEQFELLKAMASKDTNTRIQAQEAFAALVSPVISTSLAQAPILANFYTTMNYDMGTTPMLPTELFYDITDVDYFTVYSQTMAGGLGTNEAVPTVSEMPIKTYSIDSAISFDKKYAANPRLGLNVVSNHIARLMQEILYKQENFSVGPLMNALANASTNGRRHVQRVVSAGRLVPADFNKLLTLGARINTSWLGGTPVGGSRDVSDIIMSPESMEELRAMAYNPINTAAAPYTDATKDSITAPDAIRSQFFNSADLPSFYGKVLHVFNEFGKGRRFNSVFDLAAGSTNYAQDDGSTGSAAFDGATSEILVALDRGRDPLIRLGAVDSESGSEFTLQADDQFFASRQRKMGFYGSMEEGRLVVNTRALCGLIR